MVAPESLVDEFSKELATKYELIETLGGGGMGRVLLARHRQLKELVAIKLLHRDHDVRESLTRFLREARAAARIRSPHVARVMDAGILSNGQPYIVMEYLRGCDLAHLLAAKGPLPPEQAVEFVLQALEAIAEAHALGIIHRDLKPGNLFAAEVPGDDSCIKVLDFGVAKTDASFETLDPGMTERGAILGTPNYMSPEQFDAIEVDVRADIWGVGALLFELLVGEPPFRGSTLPQLYGAVMRGAIKRIRTTQPDVPAGLEAVVDVCLQRDRELRYSNVAELARALCEFGGPHAGLRVERITRVLNATPSQGLVTPATPRPGDPVFSGTSETLPELQAVSGARTARVGRRTLVVAALALGVLLLIGLGMLRLTTQTDRNAAEATPPATPTPKRAVALAGSASPPLLSPPPPQGAAADSATRPESAPSQVRRSGVSAKPRERRRVSPAAPAAPPAERSIYEKYP